MACVMLNLETNFAISSPDRNPSRRNSAWPKNLESRFRSLWKTNNLEHTNHTTTYKLLIKRPNNLRQENEVVRESLMDGSSP